MAMGPSYINPHEEMIKEFNRLVEKVREKYFPEKGAIEGIYKAGGSSHPGNLTFDYPIKGILFEVKPDTESDRARYLVKITANGQSTRNSDQQLEYKTSRAPILERSVNLVSFFQSLNFPEKLDVREVAAYCFESARNKALHAQLMLYLFHQTDSEVNLPNVKDCVTIGINWGAGAGPKLDSHSEVLRAFANMGAYECTKLSFLAESEELTREVLKAFHDAFLLKNSLLLEAKLTEEQLLQLVKSLEEISRITGEKREELLAIFESDRQAIVSKLGKKYVPSGIEESKLSSSSSCSSSPSSSSSSSSETLQTAVEDVGKEEVEEIVKQAQKEGTKKASPELSSGPSFPRP